MTQVKAAIRVNDGPSWEQIERSLRDTEFCLRTVDFVVGQERNSNSVRVCLDSAKRLDDKGDQWELLGAVQGGPPRRVFVNFRTDTRKGYITFIAPHEAPVPSLDTRKANALWRAICLMQMEYEKHHTPSHRSTEIYRLGEVARRICYFKDDGRVGGITLDDAIADLKKC